MNKIKEIRYNCGFALNSINNDTVMIYVRYYKSDIINLFSNCKSYNVRYEFNPLNVINELTSLALCDYTIRKFSFNPNLPYKQIACLIYQDLENENRVRIFYEDASIIMQDSFTYITNFAKNHGIEDYTTIVSRIIGNYTNFDENIMPHIADFSTIEQTNDIAKSLDEFYKNNESMTCIMYNELESKNKEEDK